ncbi:MAG: AAA family ATPase [Pseudonocardia sp.]|uniref:ATP-binding protein n=1 Tax=Pseudonocardia sp. TaxID=60912 RepID=UPI001AC51F4D|nr:BTAD domain-containing putative transcriptional regulator [Pseudonocardia sp.]MBN9101967.1 AAA family ATPase [Pseudonocardia sp.]
MSIPIEYRVLGPVAVLDVAGTSLTVGGARRRALLAALLLHRGVSLSVERLVDMLWSAPAPPTAATMVHGAVAGLRRVLEPDRRDAAPAVLVNQGGGYALQIAPEQIDAVRFERLLGAGRQLVDGAPERAARLLSEALTQWRAPALEGVGQPFARTAAVRWDELRLQCVELHAQAELRLGHHHAVVAALESVMDEDPLREGACAQLMIALYRCGRQADALAAYRTLRRALVEDLGVEPGADLQRLETSILRHGEEMRDTRTRPARPAGRGTPLPAPVGSLVGRARDQSDVVLQMERHRLVTLTGVGGAGKTRLASEVRRHLAERGECDTFLVDLAPLTAPALIEETLAEAVGVRAEPGQPLARTLASALSAQPAVVVFDNCEHLIAACAGLVQALLAATGEVRIVATSREPLGVPGEHVHPVRPLRTPAVDESWEQVASCEAVVLFAARAAAARPGFAITARNAALIGEVCRRLDGLPLAIELAAARAAAMPLDELVGRLDDRFTLLESATRAADIRHRSLAATLAWSLDLLTDPERTIFGCLTVFPAAFDLAAATAICADRVSGDVALLLVRLVTCSLVQFDDDDDAGGARYRLLETVRAYGRGQLDPSTLCALEDRHAAYHLDRARAAQPHLFVAGSGVWLEQLHADRLDLRAALQWCFGAGGDPDRGAALVSCLWHYWDLRGARDEGLRWVHAALESVGADRPALRLPLLSAGALLHLGRADFAATVDLATEQLALARRGGDRAAEGDALALLATVDWARGRFDRAQQRYEDGIGASLDGGDVWGAAMAEAQLARLHRDRHEPDAARAVGRRSLAHAESVGESLARGLARDVLASLEHQWGDEGEASRLVVDALELYRGVGYREGEASAQQLAGAIALRAGRTAEARAAYAESLQLSGRIGHRASTAAALEGLAAVASAAGEPAEAAELVRSASSLRAEIGMPPGGD